MYDPCTATWHDSAVAIAIVLVFAHVATVVLLLWLRRWLPAAVTTAWSVVGVAGFVFWAGFARAPWLVTTAAPFVVLVATWWRNEPGGARRGLGWGAVAAALVGVAMAVAVWRAAQPQFVCCFGVLYQL